MSKTKIRFVFTLEDNSLEMRLSQYLKSGSSSKEKFFEAALAYYLPLVLEEDKASPQAIIEAIEDCCYSLEQRLEYMRRRLSRQEKTSSTSYTHTPAPTTADPEAIPPVFNDEELY